MAVMSHEELRRVTPWEVCVLIDARSGATYRQIATKHGKTAKSVERTFERLRSKLRPWGGGTKAGLVHWIDTYEVDWTYAVGMSVSSSRD